MQESVSKQKSGLSAGARFGYASAEIGINAVETTIRLFLLKFATDSLLIPPALAGALIAIGIAWDAITDPWMGWVSDRRVARGGARRDFLPLGAVVLSAAVVLLLATPLDLPLIGRTAWLLGAYLLVNTGMTIIAVPHMTMGAELTPSRDERSALFAARFACMNLGAFTAIALPTVLLQSETAAWHEDALTWGAALALLVLAGGFNAYRATKGRIHAHRATKATPPLLRSAKAALRNRAFRPLIAAYMIAYLGIALNGGLATYYYEYRLGLSKSEWQQILLVFMVVFTISLAFWVLLAKRFGKLKPLRSAILMLGLGNSALYLFAPPGNLHWPLWGGAVLLGFFVGAVALLDSMLTDVVDYGRLRSRDADAGIYFGVWRFGGKSTRALAIALTGLLLDAIGFVPNVPQSESTREALAWIFGPGVGFAWTMAALLLFGYRYGDQEQQRVQALLRRRGLQTSAET